MLIRHSHLDDLDTLVDLENKLFSSPWSQKDFLFEMNQNPFSQSYVIEENHCMIGYVFFSHMYENVEIATIGVNPTYQQQGIGSQLLQKVIVYAQEKQCLHISLEVRMSNKPAIGLYEKYGFIKKAVRKNYYQDNHEDAYLMVKELGGKS